MKNNKTTPSSDVSTTRHGFFGSLLSKHPDELVPSDEGPKKKCGHVVTTYILPSLMHFVSYILGFIYFRINENEQLYALMEKVFLAVNQSLKIVSQDRVIKRLKYNRVQLKLVTISNDLSTFLLLLFFSLKDLLFSWPLVGDVGDGAANFVPSCLRLRVEAISSELAVRHVAVHSADHNELSLLGRSHQPCHAVRANHILHARDQDSSRREIDCAQRCHASKFSSSSNRNHRFSLINLTISIQNKKQILDIRMAIGNLNSTVSKMTTLVTLTFLEKFIIGLIILIMNQVLTPLAWTYRALFPFSWLLILSFTLFQVSRLNSKCSKLKQIALSARVYGYHNCGRDELDSFLLFMVNTNLRAKLFGIPMKPSYLLGSFLIISFVIIIIIQMSLITSPDSFF